MRANRNLFLLSVALSLALTYQPCWSSGPAKAKTEGTAKAKSEVLVLHFPNVAGLGRLETVLGPSAVAGLERISSNKHKLADAIGTVRLPADQCRSMCFRPGATLIKNPQLLDAIAPENIWAIRFSFTSTIDSEDALADRLVAKISHLKDLNSINLANCDVSDLGAKGLHDLPKLQRLDLGRSLITGKTVPVLGKLMSLEHLNLDCTDLANADLGPIARLPKLWGLGLHAAQIKDSQLVALKAAKGLTILDLSNNPGISDASLPTLTALEHLQYLDLSDSSIDLRLLKKLSRIKHIVVSERDLKGVSLQEMRRVVGNLALDAQVVESSKVIKPGKDELHLFAPTRY